MHASTLMTTPADPASRMARALKRAGDLGLSPVVVCGSGRHTTKVATALVESPVEIVAFVDDRAERQGRRILGWPIIAPEQALETGAAAVILNSDGYEPEMWRRRGRYESAGMQVLRLYPELDEARQTLSGIEDIEAAMTGPTLLPRQALHAFWSTRGSREANASNALTKYRDHVGWSMVLADWISEAGVTHEAPILELGCNIGRNLALLRYRGYRNLHAIEINAHAIEAMRCWYPDTARRVQVHHGAIEELLPQLADDSVDLVFTSAVLVHVHADADFVFEHMRRVARRFILTAEDEHSSGPRHVPRDYGALFTRLGCRLTRQLAFADASDEEMTLLGLEREYVLRLFESR